MNILIPIGGKGERFKNNNYTYPKFLINIYGHPMLFWILDNLKFNENDNIIIAIPENINCEFGLEYKLKKEYPNIKIRIINLLYQPRGATETLFSILQNMNEIELNKKTISLDCDTIYFDDILKSYRECDNNACFFFKPDDKIPIFSYLKLNDFDTIIDIKEKEFFLDTEICAQIVYIYLY